MIKTIVGHSGVEAGQGMSMEDIAIKLGISRERVRQILENALRKMRNNGHHRVLRAYLDMFHERNTDLGILHVRNKTVTSQNE